MAKLLCWTLLVRLTLSIVYNCRTMAATINTTTVIEPSNVDVTTSSPPSNTNASTASKVITRDCTLSADNPLMHNTVTQLVKDKVTLIEYRLSFANYTYNPLTTNVTSLYSGNKWSRVTTSHGQVPVTICWPVLWLRYDRLTWRKQICYFLACSFFPATNNQKACLRVIYVCHTVHVFYLEDFSSRLLVV